MRLRPTLSSRRAAPPASSGTGGQPAGQSEQATRSLPKSDGVKVAIVGAFATAFASAIFSGIHFDWFAGDGDPPRVLKPVSAANGAITTQVPTQWGTGEADWDVVIGKVVDPGAGLRSGVGVGAISNHSYDVPSVWVGGSSAAARRLQLTGRSPAELSTYMVTLARTPDWTKDGCVFGREVTLDKPGFVGTYRLWRNCSGFEGTRFWDVYAVSLAGDALVQSQLVGTSKSTEKEEEAQLTQWSVRPELLPEGKPKAAERDFFPRPSWVKDTVPSTGRDLVIP